MVYVYKQVKIIYYINNLILLNLNPTTHFNLFLEKINKHPKIKLKELLIKDFLNKFLYFYNKKMNKNE